MTERVQIVVEARDQASGILRAIAGQFGQIGNLMQELTSKNINWGNILEQGGRLVIDVMKQSIDATTKYAEEVRNLSMVSGQSAEDTSRMLQVMDDFQITADDATTAVRTLTKEGLAPTTETLAKLADEYVTLNSAQAKNELILKNLGRSGLQWANMLSKGGDAIRNMSDAVDENLILTQDNINAAEDYRLALDDWNDAVQSVKISLGNELLPVLADVLSGMTKFSDVSLEMQKTTEYANMSIFERARAVIQQTNALTEQEQAERSTKAAIEGTTAATEENTDAAKANEDAMKALSKANQTLLSNMFTLQNDAESFAQDEQKRANDQKDIDAERIQLAMERQSVLSEIALIKDAEDIKETSRQQKLIDLNQKLNDLNVEGLKLTEKEAELSQQTADALDHKSDAANRAVYNILEQKAAADGLVSTDEVQFLQDTAVTMGLVDRASADAAIQASKTADEFWNGFQQTGQAMTSLEGTVTASTNQMGQDFLKLNGPMEKTRLLMQGIAAYDGRVIQYGVNFSTSGSIPGSSDLGISPIGGGRAAGGPVYAGTGYPVGERGPEWFVPSQNGTIIPNDKLQKNVTIYVNADVRNLNDLDYFAQEVARRIT